MNDRHKMSEKRDVELLSKDRILPQQIRLQEDYQRRGVLAIFRHHL